MIGHDKCVCSVSVSLSLPEQGLDGGVAVNQEIRPRLRNQTATRLTPMILPQCSGPARKPHTREDLERARSRRHRTANRSLCRRLRSDMLLNKVRGNLI